MPSTVVDNGLTNGASQSQTMQDTAPTKSTEAVLKPSAPIPTSTPEVSGIEFNNFHNRNMTVAELVSGMQHAGFQASAIAEAATIIDEMRAWRDPDNPERKATVFLGYTSNLVSSGLRSVLRWLIEHEYVDAVVTTAGGIEEDLIKCLAPTYLSSFSANGAALRSQGMNRIGNLVVPNSNYCAFEDWVVPILDQMLEEQESTKHLPDENEVASEDVDEDNAEDLSPLYYKKNANNTTTTTTANGNTSTPKRKRKTRQIWTPSKIIRRLGRLIANPSSILYQAYLHNIPIFCPALTDGSLGDMLYFHTFRSSPSVLDISITRDIRKINDISLGAARAGMIVLGGGVVKHHIANACLMRNGADWAVFVNTAQEFDGSDAGAKPDEAVSWGKIKSKEEGGRSVKVYGEATVVFPLLVASTFAKVETEAK